MRIKLGDIARDTISGFQGTVIGISELLHNCDRLILQPTEMKDGKPLDAGSFDEPNLEIVEAKNRESEFAPVPERKFGLGDTVKDTLTGFEGVLTSRTVWWNGCDRYSVRSQKLHDGKVVGDEVFDGLQLDLVKAANPKPAKPTTGGPRATPSRR